MQQVLRIAGMHCDGCVKRVTRALQTVTPNVTVSLAPPQAVLEVPAAVSLDELKAALQRAGEYTLEPSR